MFIDLEFENPRAFQNAAHWLVDGYRPARADWWGERPLAEHLRGIRSESSFHGSTPSLAFRFSAFKEEIHSHPKWWVPHTHKSNP